MDEQASDPTPRLDLFERRSRARWRAMAAFAVGVVTLAVTAAMLAFVCVFVIARFWTWIRRRDIDQFWLWELAPEAAIGLSALVLLGAIAFVFRFFWVGAVDRVLRQLVAVRVDGGGDLGKLDRRRVDRLVDVVDALSIGLGRQRPELWVIAAEGVVANSLALRSSDRRVLVVTAAVLDLPRAEQEAMAAHELAHLHATDAHWVTSGLVALSTARRAGMEVWALGVVLVMISGYLLFQGTFLWGTMAAGIGLFVTGGIAGFTFVKLERSVRLHSDELADVAAVHLAKDPVSLGRLCLRLGDATGQIQAASIAAESLWFELVQRPAADGAPDAFDVVRSRRDMYLRARRAFTEAREPMPPDDAERVEAYLREHERVP